MFVRNDRRKNTTGYVYEKKKAEEKSYNLSYSKKQIHGKIKNGHNIKPDSVKEWTK